MGTIASENRTRLLRMGVLHAVVACSFLLASCAPSAAPSPTAAPAKPAAETKPAAPAAPAPPAAPAAPAAQPAAAPKAAESPAAAKAAPPVAKVTGPPVEIKVAGLFLNSDVVYAPLFVGEKLGYFRDAGVTMQATNFNEPPATINSIGRDFDWGMVSPQVGINAFLGGRSELRVIAGMLNTSTIAFAVPKDSPVRTPADLKGMKIAIGVPNGTCHNWAIDMVRAAGLDPERDVEMVAGMPAGFVGLWTSTKTGQFGATCLIPPTTVQATAKDGGRIIYNSADNVKGWTNSAMVTTADVIQRKREGLTRMLAAWRAAGDYISNNPDESAKIWGEAINLETELAVGTIKDLPKVTWSLRVLDDAYQAIEKQMVSSGQLKATVDWKTLHDRSLLPADLQAP